MGKYRMTYSMIPIIAEGGGSPPPPVTYDGWYAGTPTVQGADELHGGTPATVGTDTINGGTP